MLVIKLVVQVVKVHKEQPLLLNPGNIQKLDLLMEVEIIVMILQVLIKLIPNQHLVLKSVIHTLVVGIKALDGIQ